MLIIIHNEMINESHKYSYPPPPPPMTRRDVALMRVVALLDALNVQVLLLPLLV